MLCLTDSIRDDDPSMQHLLCLLEDARSCTALVLTAWQVARVLAVHLVETVLAERARQPTAAHLRDRRRFIWGLCVQYRAQSSDGRCHFPAVSLIRSQYCGPRIYPQHFFAPQ